MTTNIENKMENFDKIIKEKAEKKEFKYKPIFWLFFAKQAGFAAFSVTQIISAIVIFVGIAGGTIYYTLSSKQPKSSTPQMEENMPVPVLENEELTLLPSIPETIPSPQLSKPIQKATITDTLPSSPKNIIKQDTNTQKAENKNYRWTISRINPDTIPTND